MSNYRSANDIKIAALFKAGELTDGTSSYDAVALQYASGANQALFSGGNEFGIDTGEEWSWAKAKNPILLTLSAPYTTGSVTMTNGSRSGTFSSIPVDPNSNQISLQGWFLHVDTVDDWYRIAYHVSGSTSFTLDQPWIASTATFSTINAVQLDYDLTDDTVIVDQYNNVIDFKGNAGGTLSATLNQGVYTPTGYIQHVATQIQAADTGTYTGSWNAQTRKFTLAHGGVTFQLLFGSGTNVAVSASKSLGLDVVDTTAAASYTSTYPLNGIQRIAGPLVMYREQNLGFDSYSTKESGKIFGLNFHTMKDEYPISRIIQGTPDRFCVIHQRDNGIFTIRLNRYPATQMRVECDYLPIERDLQDNQNCFPRIPRAFREYLVLVSAYYILLDKSDNKAEEIGGQAKAKLQAMVNHERKTVKSSGKNYGKLVARRTQSRAFIRSTDT